MIPQTPKYKVYNNSNSQIGVSFISNGGLSFLNEAFHCFSKMRILWGCICNRRFILYIYIYIYIFFFLRFIFWLWEVFFGACKLSPVEVSRGCCSLQCPGFSLWWLLLLQSTGSSKETSVVVALRLWSTGSIVVAPGLSCSAACGVFPDQGLYQYRLHCKADS